MFEESSKFCCAGVMAPLLLLGLLANYGCESPTTPTSNAVVFEGAGLIVGDGSPPIENAAFVVDGGRSSKSALPRS
jgi:hypothetical protein